MAEIHRFDVDHFEHDDLPQPAVALMLETQRNDSESAVHQHRKGQLVVAYRGGIVCTVEDGVWMVPSGFGVWIPGGVAHSNRVTANGQVFFLFVEPGAASMPEHCCTLALSSLILELIIHLSGQVQTYPDNSSTARLVGVLLEQLEQAPSEQLYLPLPASPRLRTIARSLAQDPQTVRPWPSGQGMWR